MARLTTVDITAKNEIVKKTPGYAGRENLRQALQSLPEDKAIELEPEGAEESLRKLKVSVQWAAKETGKSIAYGVTPRQTLLVWLDNKEKAAPSPAGKKRGRPRKERSTAEAERVADQMGLEENSNP